MAPATNDTVAAIQAADHLIWRLEPIVCDTCQDQCYTLEGRATGDLGDRSWETPIAWIAHSTLSTALATLARTTGNQAGRLKRREAEAALIELQGTLW